MAKEIPLKEARFLGPQGLELACASLVPKKPRFRLFVQHGFSEHYRRYLPFAQKLAAQGAWVELLDLPGHGLSQGVRGHVDDFSIYLESLQGYIEQQAQDELPNFLLGHSMGGLISASLMMKKPGKIQGLILSSPLAGLGALTTHLGGAYARHLAQKNPAKQIAKSLEAASLCRNRDKWKEYYTDPLRLNLITPALFLGMLAYCQNWQNNAIRLDLPLLVMMSSQDRVVSPDAIQRVFKDSGSKDKQLVVFTRSRHEIVQEAEAPQFTAIALDWINQRLG